MKFSVEQLLLLFLFVGLPLLRTIAEKLRNKHTTRDNPEARTDFSQVDRDYPNLEKGPPKIQRQTPQLKRDIPQLRRDIPPLRETVPGRSERPHSQQPTREISPRLPPALEAAFSHDPVQAIPRTTRIKAARSVRKDSVVGKAEAALRQIPRDISGQRRAIVLMAVFGPPRSLEPPP